MNKRVRAWNVKVGDELPWWNSKTRRVCTMVVKTVSVHPLPDDTSYVAMDLYKKGARRKQTYVWRCAKNSLVIVRREDQ